MSDDDAIRVLVPNDIPNDVTTLKDLVEDFGAKFAQEFNKITQEAVYDKPSFEYAVQWLYYQPQLRVKLAVVLFSLGILLVLALVDQVPAFVSAFCAVFVGLVVISIVASTIRMKLKARRDKKTRDYPSLRRVTDFTRKESGSSLFVSFFGAFGLGAIFIPDSDLSFWFLCLFGLAGFSVALLIGFQAWNKKTGVEPFLIVEAVFDIILTFRFSSTSFEETIFLSIAGVFASVAVICALLHVYIRPQKGTQPNDLQCLRKYSELVISVAFLTTDAADVVLLASQLLLLNRTRCNVDPKLVVVAGLLALNPSITELSAAFKSEGERRLARDLHELQQQGDSTDNETKIAAKRVELITEQARGRRMQRKVVLQTVVIGLGAFPLFYLAAFLLNGQGSFYLLFVPVVALVLYFLIDSTRLRGSWIRRRALNNYFFSALFRAFGICFALSFSLSTTYFTECNEQLAFAAWALYQLAPLVVVTVIKSVQREDLLMPFGSNERYEDALPKIIRPACADLAWYYMDKVNIATKENVKAYYAEKLIMLFTTSLKRKRDIYTLAMLIDAMGSLVESPSRDLQFDHCLLDGSPEDLLNIVLTCYDFAVRDTQPYDFFQSAVERVVVSLLLSNRDGTAVLERVIESVESIVPGEALLATYATVLDNKANVLYLELAKYNYAEVLAHAALRIARGISKDEEKDPAIALYLNNLAQLLQAQGKYDEALEMNYEALAINEKVYEKEHPKYALQLNNLALLLSKQAKHDEALPMFYEALRIFKKVYGKESPEYATNLNNLAYELQAQGKFDDALELNYEALAIREKVFGKEHPKYALQLNNLAKLLSDQGKYDEALPMLYEALRIDKKVYGDSHPEVATDLNSLAKFLRAQGNTDEALQLCSEGLEIRLKSLGDDHPSTATSYNDLGGLYMDKADYEKAEEMFRKAVNVYNKKFGDTHPWVATGLNNLAQLLSKQGKYDEALPLYNEALAISEKVYGKESPNYAIKLNNLAQLLSEQGKYDKALELNYEALAIREKVFGRGHPKYALQLNNLALLLQEQGNYEEAEKIMREVLAIDERIFGREHPVYTHDLNNLALMLWGQDNDSQEAAELGRKALSIAEAKLGHDHPTTQAYRRDWG